MNVEESVQALVSYGIDKNLIQKEDAVYTANTVFDVLGVEPSYEFSPLGGEPCPLEDILKVLLNDAQTRGYIEEGIASRDLFDTKIMGCLTPRPSEVIRRFRSDYSESPMKATDNFYALSLASDYIRSYRVKKDRKWKSDTKYGKMDITINLSKPEKDPKAIAAALKKKQDAYPRCLLCRENEGYAGRLDHPARETIRLIPLTLGGEEWYLQYSPYVYYNEHCIVLSGKHMPMKIDKGTFVRLLEFIRMFPHYIIGSNADLPIVGGSILTHEHFQGGRYTFAMATADIREELVFSGYEDVKAGIVHWPMSVIRLDGSNPDRLAALSDKILRTWRTYSDPGLQILSETDGTPHNTITLIARKVGDLYEMDLVLRNNRTTDEYPLGIFHPHAELHHIKKENIGLIEVMGLAVLPSRLLSEMKTLEDSILAGEDLRLNPVNVSHADWAEEILKKYPDFAPDHVVNDASNADRLHTIVKDEIGLVFSKVLEQCGVYKDTDEGRAGFHRFADEVNLSSEK